MKFAYCLTILGAAAILVAGTAWGGGKNGIGLYGGIVRHKFHRKQDVGEPLDFTSVGINVTGDAQFMINESWSIVPALMFSREKTSNIFNVPGNTEGTVTSYNATLQGRLWFGGIFLGAHVGVYQASVKTHTGQVFETGGNGFGVAGGWESEGGFILNIQFDLQERAFDDTEKVSAIRLQAGFRWH